MSLVDIVAYYLTTDLRLNSVATSSRTVWSTAGEHC